jgi:hypothetical protein
MEGKRKTETEKEEDDDEKIVKICEIMLSHH